MNEPGWKPGGEAERALALLGQVHSPVGMEQRVLQRLRAAEADRLQAPRWPTVRSARIPVTALCAVVMVAVIAGVIKKTEAPGGGGQRDVAHKALPSVAELPKSPATEVREEISFAKPRGHRLHAAEGGANERVVPANGAERLVMEAGLSRVDLRFAKAPEDSPSGDGIHDVPGTPLPSLEGAHVPGQTLAGVVSTTPGKALPGFNGGEVPGDPLPSFELAFSPERHVSAFSQTKNSGDQR